MPTKCERTPGLWAAEEIPAGILGGVEAGEGGTSQLSGEATTSPSGRSTSAYQGSTRDLTPRSKGAIPRSPILTGGKTMTAELEVVVDRSVDGEKLLRMPG